MIRFGFFAVFMAFVAADAAAHTGGLRDDLAEPLSCHAMSVSEAREQNRCAPTGGGFHCHSIGVGDLTEAEMRRLRRELPGVASVSEEATVSYGPRLNAALFNFFIERFALPASPVDPSTDAGSALSARAVERLQEELAQRGCYHQEIDGQLGPRTFAGMLRYLWATGRFDFDAGERAD